MGIYLLPFLVTIFLQKINDSTTRPWTSTTEPTTLYRKLIIVITAGRSVGPWVHANTKLIGSLPDKRCSNSSSRFGRKRARPCLCTPNKLTSNCERLFERVALERLGHHEWNLQFQSAKYTRCAVGSISMIMRIAWKYRLYEFLEWCGQRRSLFFF